MSNTKIFGANHGISTAQVIPDNQVALEIESTDAKDYITIDTTDGSEVMTLTAGGSAGQLLRIEAARMRYAASGTMSILAEDPTATNPVFCPNANDDDTGIGWAAADQLSLVAGGQEGIRITEAGDAITAVDVKGPTKITGPTGTTGMAIPATNTALLVENAGSGSGSKCYVDINADGTGGSGVRFFQADAEKASIAGYTDQLLLKTEDESIPIILTCGGTEAMRLVRDSSSDKIMVGINGAPDDQDNPVLQLTGDGSESELIIRRAASGASNDEVAYLGYRAQGIFSIDAEGGIQFRNHGGSKRGEFTPNGKFLAYESATVKGEATFVLTGSIDVTGTNVNVPGTNTKYLTELSIGDAIVVSGETRTIATITDDTTATVTAAWGSDLANDTSPECNPAAFTVIRDTGDLGMVLDDNGLVGLGEVVPSAYWANTNDLVIGSGSSSGITIDASSTGTLCFAYGTSGAAAYQNVIQGTGSGSGDGIRFITAGTTKECIRITTAGDILCPQLDASSDVLTDANKNLTTSSDMRLKNPIAELEAGLDKINQLVPRFFSWKNDEENKSQLGFFSQEVHSICPEAAPKSPKMVSTETEVGEDGANACDGEKVRALDADGNPDFNWSLNSRAIVALLVKSVQELSAKVTALEAGD